MTNQSEYTNKEELREVFIHALARELAEKDNKPGTDFSKYWKMAERRLNKVIKSRESALLSRAKKLVGENETEPHMCYECSNWSEGRNQLREIWRTKLDQLSKEIKCP